jgi:hypothetical protein
MAELSRELTIRDLKAQSMAQREISIQHNNLFHSRKR